MRRAILSVLVAGIVIGTISGATAAEDPYLDDFPSGLSNYATGGWQGPLGDGTGGTIAPTTDNAAVYMDGTVNALSYAIRDTPQLSGVTVTVDFTIVKRDSTEADQFSILMRWRNPTYPNQSGCPPCIGPNAESGIVVNLNIGRSRVAITEVTDFVGTEIAEAPQSLSTGNGYVARVVYSGSQVSVYINDVRQLAATVPNKPAGLVGIMAYRVDVSVDSVLIEPGTVPPTPFEAFVSSPWLVGLVAWVIGVLTVLVVSAALRRMRRRQGG